MKEPSATSSIISKTPQSAYNALKSYSNSYKAMLQYANSTPKAFINLIPQIKAIYYQQESSQ